MAALPGRLAMPVAGVASPIGATTAAHNRTIAKFAAVDFEIPAGHRRLPRRARRVHRARDRAAPGAGRQRPLLRPPPRGRPHRLGPRRPAQRGVGGAARRDAPPGRRRRPLPLRLPEGVRRQGGHQPRAWRSSASTSPARASACTTTCRTSRRSSATTSASCSCSTTAPRSRRPSGSDDLLEGTERLRLRHHRARPRLRRHPHGDHRRARRRRVGHQRREDVEHRHPQGALRPDLRPHQRRGRRRRRHHRASSCPRHAPASRSSSSCGPSTCRPTTPTSASPTCGCRDSAIFGGEGKGLGVVQLFFNENRIRQAASSLGAAEYCLDQAIAYANERKPVRQAAVAQPGRPVPDRRARHAVRDAARPHPQDGVGDGHLRRVLGQRQGLDVQLLGQPPVLRGRRPGHAGPRRPRLLAATRQFEHIYRHHRRYRITEGAEEIQMRRVAGYLFGFMNQQAPEGRHRLTR